MKKLSVLLMITTFLFILSSCGGGGSNSAPAEAVMTASVESISADFKETAPYVCGLVQSFFITVRDKATSVPLNNVDLTIFFPYAEPYLSTVQLYDGDPAKGGVPKDAPMTVSTDENGAYTVFFTYCGGGGDEYSNYFQITSGPLFESVFFEVTSTADTGG